SNMSLLKRIGGSGPLDGTGEGNRPAGNPSNGAPGQTGRMPTQAPQTTNLPRQTTGRVGQPSEDLRRPGGLSNQENMLELKNRVQQKLIAELDPKLDLTKTDEVRRNVEEIFSQILESAYIILS